MESYHPDYPQNIPQGIEVDPEELARKAGSSVELARLGKVANLLAKDFLLKYDGLVAMGPTLRTEGDEKTACLTFFVAKKKPLSRLAKAQVLPKQLRVPRKLCHSIDRESVPSGVVEVGGEFRASQCNNNPRTFHETLQGGLSIGPRNRFVFGTLTVVGRGNRFATCHHVVADDIGRSSDGIDIVHPSESHAVGGDQAFVGQVSRGPALLPLPLPNFADIAVGRCTPQLIRTNQPLNPPQPIFDRGLVLCEGQTSGVGYPAFRRRVRKRGAQTGRSVGRVLSPHLAAIIDYNGTRALFLDQVLIDIPQDEGDSGSGVFTASGNQFVGMINGGSGRHAVASPWWWISIFAGFRP